MRQATVLKQMIGARTGIKALLIKAYFTLFDPVRGQKRFLAKLKHSNKRAGRIGFRKTPLHWFREFLDLDPELIFKNTICPTLAIAGSKDFQCRPEDLAAIETAISGPIESHLLDDMSHLLRHEPGDPSVFNYAEQIKQPLLPEVQELILEWLNSHIEAEMESSNQPV
ncbi:MAG: alpha/beta hydrolase [Gammaproteobacteria bacterium]|nr:alpha/beta hydrolase [Gammaproteobacteria bacterium]